MNRFNIFLRLRATEKEEADIVLRGNTLLTINPKTQTTHQYKFDEIFSPDLSQVQICQRLFKPLLECHTLKQEHCLLFAYGVTGSGKTHTISGTPEQPGIIPGVFNQLFSIIETHQNLEKNISIENNLPVMDSGPLNIKNSFDWKNISSRFRKEHSIAWKKWEPYFDLNFTKPTDDNDGVTYNVFLRYVEVYNNYVYDLFDFPEEARNNQPWIRKPLQNRIDANKRSYVENAKNILVVSAWDAMKIFLLGSLNRQSKATNLNRDSSRSHCILTIRLFRNQNLGNGQHSVRESHFSIVDLAGVERLSRTTNQGKTASETNNINLSLMALRSCFQSFKDKSNNVNGKEKKFTSSLRQNKLTSVLKDLLESPNTNISMVVCMNPSQEDFADNYHVLDFAKDCVTIDWPAIKNVNYQNSSDFILGMNENDNIIASDEHPAIKSRNPVKSTENMKFRSKIQTGKTYRSSNINYYKTVSKQSSFTRPEFKHPATSGCRTIHKTTKMTWYEKVRAEYLTPKNVKHSSKVSERSVKFRELVKFWKNQQTPDVTPMISNSHDHQKNISGGIRNRTQKYLNSGKNGTLSKNADQPEVWSNFRLKFLTIASKIQSTLKFAKTAFENIPHAFKNQQMKYKEEKIHNIPIDWKKESEIPRFTTNSKTHRILKNISFSQIDFNERTKALRSYKKLDQQLEKANTNRIAKMNTEILSKTEKEDSDSDEGYGDQVLATEYAYESNDSFELKLEESSEESDIEISLPDSIDDYTSS